MSLLFSFAAIAQNSGHRPRAKILTTSDFVASLKQKNSQVKTPTQYLNRSTASTPGCLLDSSITHHLDTLNTFVLDNKQVYSYNNQSLVNSEVDYFLSPLGGSPYWSINSRTTYTYDNHNNTLSELQQNPSSTSPLTWVNNLNTLYTYNQNNLITSQTDQSWNSANNTWVMSYLNTYSYNSNNSMTLEISQRLNSNTGFLQNDTKSSYSYDAANNLAGAASQLWDTVSNNWINYVNYSVSANGNQIYNYTGQMWDPASNSWKNSYKTLFTYDSQNNETQELNQVWDHNMNLWVNDNRYVITYDANNNETSDMGQSWDISTNSWQNDYKTTNTYDAYNNVVLSDTRSWNSITNNWDNVHGRNQSDFFYDCRTVGIAEEKSSMSQFSVFPNPAQSILSIKSDAEFNTISIIGINGQTLIKSEQPKSLDVSSLEKGIYFIQLADKDNTILQTRKFVKN